MSTATVSHSEVDQYLLCRRKHYYGYVLGLTAADTSAALATGTAGHAVLAVFYQAILDGEDFAAAEQLAEEALKQIYAEGYTDREDRAKLVDILFDPTYGYFAQEFLVRQGWEILAVEKEFNLEYDEGKGYPFVVDLIARDPQGLMVVIDHKFQYDFFSENEVDLLPQIPKYIAALRGLGYRITYGAYNQLRTRRIVGKKSAAHPDGKGPEPAQAYSFYPMRPNPAKVTRTLIEQAAVAREVQQRKDNLSEEEQEATAYRVGSKLICRSCDFHLLCNTQLSGGNVTLALESYRKRDRRAFIDVSEEAS
jgi:hypothetical protein